MVWGRDQLHFALSKGKIDCPPAIRSTRRTTFPRVMKKSLKMGAGECDRGSKRAGGISMELEDVREPSHAVSSRHVTREENVHLGDLPA